MAKKKLSKKSKDTELVILKKLDILSVAKVLGVISSLFGLIIGISYLILYQIGMPIADVGIIGLIIFTIFYGIIGFIAGALGALIYNVIADWIGGIEIELKK